MGFFAALAISFALFLVGELIRPKTPVTNAKASALDDFTIATAEEGRNIPVFFGKVKFDGPNVTWYGDLKTVAIKKKVKTGLFSSKKQTIGYRYSLGLEACICHSWDAVTLHEIRFDDEADLANYTRAVQSDGSTVFTFDDPEYFGGKESGGGVAGTLRFYPGYVGQQASAYLSAQFGEPAPPYEGLMRVVLEQMYLGNNTSIKNMNYVLSAYPNSLGLTGGVHRIGDDCNPASIVYELLTNRIWGCAINGFDIDKAAFTAAAQTLYNEGFGISTIYNGGSSAYDMIADIMRHVDGLVFSDPDTGLITFELARKDYVKENLPIYDESVFTQGIQFARPLWSETKNHIKATYIDRDNNFTKALCAQGDLANVTQRGGEMATETVDLTGFNSYAPAAQAVARMLKSMSYPLAKVSGPINLTTKERPRPNGTFRLQWPRRGIQDVVFRIQSVQYLSNQEGQYSIEAVEDIFAIEHVAYGAPDPNQWVNPLQAPAGLTRPMVIEAPYFLTESDSPILATMGSKPAGLAYGYYINSGTSSSTLVRSDAVLDFTATATLAGIYPATSSSIDSGFTTTTIEGVEELEAASVSDRNQGLTLALLKSATTEELVAYGSADLSARSFGLVMRGVLDTVRQTHPAGTAVYFLASGFGTSVLSQISGTLYAKLQTFNGRGVQPLTDATLLTTAMTQRAASPFPPGFVRVNNVDPLTAPALPGAGFAVRWQLRDRKYTSLYDQNSASGPPDSERGTGFVALRVLNSSGALVIESTSISDMTQMATVRLSAVGTYTIELYTIRNGLSSYQRQRFPVNVTTAGTTNAIVADDAVYILDGGGA